MSKFLKTHALSLAILCGFLLRVIWSISTIDIIHPDEHFQILEPAFWTVSGFGFKAWEWRTGLRSWMGPGYFIPWIEAASWFGITGGWWLIALCKIAIAAWIIPCAFQFRNLLQNNLNLSPFAVWSGLLLFLFSGTSIVWTSATLSETESLFCLWIGLPFVLNVLSSAQSSNGKFILAGFLTVMPFWFRLQMLAWAGPLLFFGSIFYKLKPRQIFYLGWGASLAILLQGLLDWATWDHFFQSMVQNIKSNIGDDVASRYGTDPWYAYPGKMWNVLDPGIKLLSLLLAAASIYKIVLGKTLKIKKLFQFPQENTLFISAFVFIFAHSLIPHKEARFLMPMIPLYFLLGAIIVDKIQTLGRFVPVVVFLTIAFSAFTLVSKEIYSPFRGWNHGATSDAVYNYGKQHALTYANFCHIDESWVWGAGLMGTGMDGKIINIKSKEDKREKLNECNFISVKSSAKVWYAQNVAIDGELLPNRSKDHEVYFLNAEKH